MTDVLVCLGPGGVGKTTTAAALAMSAAAEGKTSVVLTVDPARRLADALGLAGTVGNEPVLIPGAWNQGNGQFWATMLDAPATLRDLIRDLAGSTEQMEAIYANRIFQNLTDSLSGTHEYMAGERLRQLSTSGQFDLVVVDTPPAHHAMDFLDSPGKLTRFFDHRLYRTILAPRKGVMRAVTSAAQMVIRTVAKVVGVELLRDVSELFDLLEGVDTAFKDRANAVDQLLASANTRYVLVTAPKPEPLRTAKWMLAELEQRDHFVQLVVANRMTPTFAKQAGSKRQIVPEDSPLRTNFDQLARLAAAEQQLVTEVSEAAGGIQHLQLHELSVPAVGLEDLALLAAGLKPFWNG